MLLEFAPQPLNVFKSNPLLTERSAAVFVSVFADLMKKWRQRD
jgi:hypothetical protein